MQKLTSLRTFVTYKFVKHISYATLFYIAVCVKVHRRVRALRELTIHIRNGLLSSSTLTGFVVPLVTKELFASTDHNIVNEAVNVIGAAASQYKWSLYFPLMKHYIRLLTRKPDKQKTVSR